MFIAFVLGIVFWQLVTTVFFIISGQDEIKTVYVGGSIPLGIVMVVCWILRHIISFIRHYNVRAILVCPNGEWRYCKSKYATFLQYNGYNFPNWTDEIKKKYPVSLWKEYAKQFNTAFSVGNLRYSPKQVWGNFQPIDKKEIQLAKKRYKEYMKEEE